MAYCCSSISSTTLNPTPPSSTFLIQNPTPNTLFFHRPILSTRTSKTISITSPRIHQTPFTSHSTKLTAHETVVSSEEETEYETEEEEYTSAEEYESSEEDGQPALPVVRRRRRRYRKQYPGEAKGITEEMRFVAMKLRKIKKKEGSAAAANGVENQEKEEEENGVGETWQPSVEGFLKYLVDSELVFRTVERIVDESCDVSYVYFRKTGLERADCISRDIEWFREQGNAIPKPSNPGVTYAQYLQELAEKSPPLFLCHFYNIYFSHIAGGQVIAKQVSKNILEGRELEFYKWEGDAEDLLRGFREKLNALGEHWSRDEKNKCLRESTKAFRSLGQIVRLIIL